MPGGELRRRVAGRLKKPRIVPPVPQSAALRRRTDSRQATRSRRNTSAGCTKLLFSTVPLFPGEAPPIKPPSLHFHFIHTVHSDALGNNAKTLGQIQLIQLIQQTARLNFGKYGYT
jgi:hypothetical protein